METRPTRTPLISTPHLPLVHVLSPPQTMICYFPNDPNDPPEYNFVAKKDILKWRPNYDLFTNVNNVRHGRLFV